MACIKRINFYVNKCLSGLWAPSLRLRRSKSGIEKLEKEMEILRARRDDIKRHIEQAEYRGRIPTDQVSQWLLEVETLEGRVAESCFSCYYCCSINRRAAEKKLWEAYDVLMSQAGEFDMIATVPPRNPTVMLPFSHRPPVGTESYMEDIVDCIDGGEGNIIGICGMSGVGKTTILKSIQHHYCYQRIFDNIIWVVASLDFQLKRLQMNIAKSLGLETLEESDDEQTCGLKLFMYLKNKSCLLLLDDIWKPVDLRLLGMTHSATELGQQQQSCKVVVFTTRIETVCAQMQAQKKIRVKCLDPDQAWQLFEHYSDEDVLSSDDRIKSVAQELAKECGGLPLALVTIAKAMLGKMSPEVWEYALHQIRDKHNWTLSGDSTIVYKAFKLSYANLENDSLRECLLYCALWPADYDIHKFDELIPYWIGCGIISEFIAINEAFSKGCDYLETLISASLLEDSRRQNDYKVEHVKMLKPVRDMALLMVSEFMGSEREWIVEAGMKLSDLPRQEKWQDVERASFMRNQIASLQEYKASTFPKLSMLILRENELLKTIPPSLFASMPYLAYLDLSRCGITELPKEICSLIELQYLNLSSTDITSLPLEFGCFKKLEYLLLRNTRIKTVPIEIISNLSMLKWLDIGGHFPVCDLWLNELKCFKGPHQIRLGITINPANFKILDLLSNVSIWNLTVSGLESSNFPIYDLSTLQWSHRISDNLECLTILDVPGDKLTINAGVDWESSFECLKTLYFRGLVKLKKLWLNRFGGFNNLHNLYISDCYMLKDVSWVLQLPRLYFLRVSNCWELEELISNDGNSNARFGIKMLILFQMNNLHRISNQLLHFPNLEYINVCHCPRLKKLPELRSSRLKEIRGNQIWWDNLDWDDNSNKDFITPKFRNQVP